MALLVLGQHVEEDAAHKSLPLVEILGADVRDERAKVGLLSQELVRISACLRSLLRPVGVHCCCGGTTWTRSVSKTEGF